MLITDLHIADLPNAHYTPYDSGMAGDHFVKNPDGSVYVGKVWPGPSVFPDFTQQQARKWWGTLYRNFSNDGAAGFWNDMNEPSIFESPTGTVPEDVVHRIDEPGFAPRTATHAEIHNIYGMENSRATFEGLRALNPDQRPLVLTRASYAGGQSYAATWTGENSSSWNHLRLAKPMLENLGLIAGETFWEICVSSWRAELLGGLLEDAIHDGLEQVRVDRNVESLSELTHIFVLLFGSNMLG